VEVHSGPAFLKILKIGSDPCEPGLLSAYCRPRTAREGARSEGVMGRIGGTGWLLAAAGAGCLTTLHATPTTAPAGATITLYGENYSSSSSSSDIFIRLDARDGPTIATISPRFKLDHWPVVIPAATARGVHTLVAMQYHASGGLLSCLPGRSAVAVTAAPSAGRGAAAPGSPSGIRVRGTSWTAFAVRGALLRSALLVLAAAGMVLVVLKRNRQGLTGAGWIGSRSGPRTG
jgi:hypothetical protein